MCACVCAWYVSVTDGPRPAQLHRELARLTVERERAESGTRHGIARVTSRRTVSGETAPSPRRSKFQIPECPAGIQARHRPEAVTRRSEVSEGGASVRRAVGHAGRRDTSRADQRGIAGPISAISAISAVGLKQARKKKEGLRLVKKGLALARGQEAAAQTGAPNKAGKVKRNARRWREEGRRWDAPVWAGRELRDQLPLVVLVRLSGPPWNEGQVRSTYQLQEHANTRGATARLARSVQQQPLSRSPWARSSRDAAKADRDAQQQKRLLCHVDFSQKQPPAK